LSGDAALVDALRFAVAVFGLGLLCCGHVWAAVLGMVVKKCRVRADSCSNVHMRMNSWR
jgi:hypothetical protein